nr:hypothetical protein [Tanacetum cinerariifolium]
MAFLVDDGERIATCQDSQELTTTAIFQTDGLDAFVSDCNKTPSASEILIAKLSACDSNILLEVPNLDIYQNNKVIAQKTKTKVVQDTTSSAQQDAMIMSVIKKMSNQVAKRNEVNKISYTSHPPIIELGIASVDKDSVIDLKPLSPKLRKNKEVHVDYLNQTKEHADTLRDIVEQARASQPLDSALNYACNIRNNRIMQPSSSNQKNKKVEDHPKNATTSLNKKNRVFDCNASTKHDVLNENSEFVCSTCKECLFNACHDLCVVDYLNVVNLRARAKSLKSNKKKAWKPTGFTDHTLVFGLGLLQAYATVMGYEDYQIGNPSPNVVSWALSDVAPIPADTTGTHSSTSIDQDASSVSTSQTSHETQSPIIPKVVATQQWNSFALTVAKCSSSGIIFDWQWEFLRAFYCTNSGKMY